MLASLVETQVLMTSHGYTMSRNTIILLQSAHR